MTVRPAPENHDFQAARTPPELASPSQLGGTLATCVEVKLRLLGDGNVGGRDDEPRNSPSGPNRGEEVLFSSAFAVARGSAPPK